LGNTFRIRIEIPFADVSISVLVRALTHLIVRFLYLVQNLIAEDFNEGWKYYFIAKKENGENVIQIL